MDLPLGPEETPGNTAPGTGLCVTGKISAMFLKATFKQGLGEAVLYLQEKPKSMTLMVPRIHWAEDLQVKCPCSLRGSFCTPC